MENTVEILTAATEHNLEHSDDSILNTPDRESKTITTEINTNPERLEVEPKADESKENDNKVKPTTTSNAVPVADKEKSSKIEKPLTLDQVLKSLNNITSVEEKLNILRSRYSDLHNHYNGTIISHKQLQKKLLTTTKERDQYSADLAKAVVAKGKLESLSRELQKQNKAVKAEALQITKNEEAKRKEVSQKFQVTITEIQQQMTETTERSEKVQNENHVLVEKLKNLLEQYELREQQIDKTLKHKDLELQLADAKLKQATLKMEQTKEIFEKQFQAQYKLLYENLEQEIEKNKLLEINEANLKKRIDMYTDKYDEFQTTLTKSNTVFESFKTEIERSSKRIKKLEKEVLNWKNRYEATNSSLVHLKSESAKIEKEKAQLQIKFNRLENLCRALQEERKSHASKNSGKQKSRQNSGSPSPTADLKMNIAPKAENSKPQKEVVSTEDDATVDEIIDKVVAGVNELAVCDNGIAE